MSGPSRAALIEEIRAFIPPLAQHLHKGASGKLGVFGGSAEYTGAPYFVAISALRTGADLAHVVCTQAAATAIKSYCPDVIVHPLLPSRSSSSSSSAGGDLTEEERRGVDAAMEQIGEWLPRFTGLVLGSGLGRDKAVQLCAKKIIEQAKDRKMPLVIDGDGISSVVCVWPSLVEGYKEVVLTPNFPEYQRLCKAAGCEEDTPVMDLARSGKLTDRWAPVSINRMGNVTIVKKGQTDKISDGRIVVECTETGSPRRCGGQGDITSGSIGTFLSWAHAYKGKDSLKYPPNVLAGYAGCLMTRQVNKAAFAKKGRSTIVSDMIEEIGQVFAESLAPHASSL